MSELTLRAVGDKELWYVTGQLPEGPWSIPLWVYNFVFEGRDYVRLTPIAALPFQADKIRELFDGPSIWQAGYSYLVEKEFFSTQAHKAPGVTPEYYRQWPGEEKGVPNKQQIQIKSGTDEPDPETEHGTNFIRFLSGKRGISYNLIKLVWWAIREEGPNWMIGERKPIDLGFCALYPLPFRQNWKDILSSKHPQAAATFKLPPPERDEILRESGFLADVCSGHNIAIDPTTHTVGWMIDAVPAKEWGETVNRIESLRLGFSRNKYVETYERTIKRLLPTILKAFTSFLEQISRPYAAVRQSGHTGRRVLLPFVRRGKLRPQAPPKLPCRVVVADQFVGFSEHCPQANLPAPPLNLPALPALLSPPDDVRFPPVNPNLDAER